MTPEVDANDARTCIGSRTRVYEVVSLLKPRQRGEFPWSLWSRVSFIPEDSEKIILHAVLWCD